MNPKFSLKMSALFHKIAVGIVVIIVILVGLLGLYMLRQTEEVTKKLEEEFHKSIVYGADITSVISKAEISLKQMSAIIASQFTKNCINNKENLDAFIKNIDSMIKASLQDQDRYNGTWFQINPEIAQESHSYFSWFFRNETGEIEKFKEIIPRDITIETDPYYFNAITSNMMVLSAPYIDPDLKQELVTISEPVYKNNILIGVSGIDFSINDIREIFQLMKQENTEINIYLYNFQRTFIAGTDQISKDMDQHIKSYLSKSENQKHTWFHNSLLFELPLHQGSSFLIVEIPSYLIYSNVRHIFLISFVLICFLIFMLVIVLIDRYRLFNYAKKTSKQWGIISGLLRSSPDMIALRDMHGIYIECNEAYAKFFNMQKEEICGKDISEVIPSSTIEETLKEDQEILTSHKSITKVEKISEKTMMYLDTIKSPLYNSDNELIGILSVSRDITDKKKAEIELIEAKKKAEELAMVKTNFLRNMTHEILTPINGLAGFLDLLGETKLDAEQMDFQNEARASADILINLVKNILEFSEIQDGHILLDNADTDIRKLAEEVISDNVQHTEKKGVIFNVKIDHKVPPNIIADKLRIRQILNIFVGNAIKYTPSEGEVLLEITPGIQYEEKARILFKVSDTGVGIDEENILKIKEAFSKCELETTKKYGGIGLGLAIANRLAILMNSEIEIESQAGKGTTFSFEVCFNTGSKYSNSFQPSEDLLKNINTLVIEKNKTTCEIISYYLEKCGCDVKIASSKEAAIKILKSEKNISVAIIGSDTACLEAAEQIRKTKDISLILLCESHKKAEAIQAREKGFALVLRKPALDYELVDAILNSIKKKKASQNSLDDSPSIDKIKVLVVEDNESHMKLVLKTLEHLGFSSVDKAIDGYEALEFCKKNIYDLVIMDCQLPKMDGYETTRRIRNLGIKTQKTAVIGLTAFSLAGEREKCMNSGMDEFLPKPIDSVELLEKLNSLKIYKLETKFKEANSTRLAHSIASSTGLDLPGAIKILNQYKKHLPKIITEIQTALDQKDFQSIMSPSRSIREISPCLGMVKLTKLSEDIQEAAEKNDFKACVTYLEEIRNCVKIIL